jgi:hypothetical protein
MCMVILCTPNNQNDGLSNWKVPQLAGIYLYLNPGGDIRMLIKYIEFHSSFDRRDVYIQLTTVVVVHHHGLFMII